MEILTAILITAFYLIGGQIEKSVRRYGVPFVAAIYTGIKTKKWRAIFLMALAGIFSMGYGESSWLRKVCKGNDGLTRLVYSLFIGVVFMLAGMKFYFIPILAAAFQVRAGTLFTVGRFDVLIEDICRAAAIFACTLLTVKGV